METDADSHMELTSLSTQSPRRTNVLKKENVMVFGKTGFARMEFDASSVTKRWTGRQLLGFRASEVSWLMETRFEDPNCFGW